MQLYGKKHLTKEDRGWMVSKYTKKETGLPVDILVSCQSTKYPWIKVHDNGRWIPILIKDQPRVIGKQKLYDLSDSDLQVMFNFIKKHKKLLLEHWYWFYGGEVFSTDVTDAICIKTRT